jgi:hypothetical protein
LVLYSETGEIEREEAGLDMITHVPETQAETTTTPPPPP